MNTKTVEKVLTHSLLYSFAVTQPLTVNFALATQLQDSIIMENKKLTYGDHGELVSHIQLKLQKLGYYEGKVDGIYGLYTEQAVRKFQSSETISINGIMDEATYEKLLKTEKTTAFKQIEEQFFSIQYGEISNDVIKVQEVLYFYGYYHGNIDGIYGPLTDEAIRKVESENILRSHELSRALNTNHTQMENTQTMVSSIEYEYKQDEPVIIPLEKKTDHNNIINKAQSFIGTPYVWGGTSPSGFDCSGFVQYVYKQENIIIPRTVNEIWNFSTPVSSPSVGDLVFFETYQPGPSHIGIYLGNGNFIHAGVSRGVEISNINDNSYWKSRYLGAKRIK